MRRTLLAVAPAMIVALATLALATLAGAAPVELKTEEDRLNYTLGFQIGNQFREDKIDLRAEALLRGISEGAGGQEPQLPKEQMGQILTALQRKVQEAAQAEAKAKAEKAVAEGKAFLEANAKKDGVKTLPSGLQYKVVKEGEGTSPKATDTVSVHYRGTLIDGKEFDSSYARNQPASFPLNQVIPGWTEGVQLMKPGAKYLLYLPAELGYGKRGAGASVPPNSVLIFEVELISIQGT